MHGLNTVVIFDEREKSNEKIHTKKLYVTHHSVKYPDVCISVLRCCQDFHQSRMNDCEQIFWLE